MPTPFRSLLLGALAAAPLLAGGAQAGDGEGRYAVKGVGLMPCKNFVSMIQEGKPEAALTISWLAGYLSGANMLLPETYDLVTWQEGVLPMMLASTCNQMPDQPVAIASNQLVQALGQGRLQEAEQPEAITVGERRTALYPSVVKAVQQRLKDEGQSLTVDGDFGPGTQKALRAYQTEKGIPSTGFPDNATMIALFTGQVPGRAQAQAQ